MPIKRRKVERLNQVYLWLVDNFPSPYPTNLILRGDKDRDSRKFEGWVELNGRSLDISINMRYPKYVLIDTLLHEMAHACTWVNKRMEPHVHEHSDEWGLVYARIYRAFNDDGGFGDSGNY